MIRATKPIQTTNQRPTTPKTMRFGGAAGKQKVLRRFIFPPVTMGTTRAAQRRGLPKRIHARIAANIVLGRPRVNGYMYEPPKKTTPAKVEVFLTLKDFKSQLKPVLTHELTHLRDYVTKGTAHTKESEDKAYSYQWATQQRLTPPKRVPRSRPSIDPPHDTTWALWALRDPRYNARLDRLIDELDETKM